MQKITLKEYFNKEKEELTPSELDFVSLLKVLEKDDNDMVSGVEFVPIQSPIFSYFKVKVLAVGAIGFSVFAMIFFVNTKNQNNIDNQQLAMSNTSSYNISNSNRNNTNDKNPVADAINVIDSVSSFDTGLYEIK